MILVVLALTIPVSGLAATLIISSEPAGADIYINGADAARGAYVGQTGDVNKPNVLVGPD